jgi:hypothetical protein
MADIKNFGIKGIAADVQMGKSGGRLVYDSGNSRFDLMQSDGATLEDLRIGTITAGAWNGTAVGTQYGGTGQNFSSSSGVIKVSSGTMSAGSIDLTADVSGALPVANGGTGATSSEDARSNLGLGNISTQASNSVNIDGGAIDGTVIGGTSPAAGSFTTISASGGFTGDLTGTADDADGLSSAVTINLSSDATGTATFQDGGDQANIAVTLASSGVSAGTYGSSSAIPVITVDAKGRVTAVSTAATSSVLTIGADSGDDDTVTVGTDTLNFVGTANEIETTVSDNQIQIGLPDNVTVGNNLTVTGSFLSDDVTASTVTINGNLTVTGTTTTVDSTTVTIADPIFEIGDDASDDNLDRGIKFKYNSGGAKVGFFGFDDSAGVFTAINDATDTSSVFSGSAGAVKFGAIEGTSFSDGTISGVTFIDEDNMASDSATAIPTQQSVKAYVDAQITAQDLDFQGDSGGALAIDLDSEALTIAGGTGIETAGSGNTLTVTLSDTAVSADTYGSTTAVPVITVDAQGRITSASTATIATSFDIGADSGSDDTVNGGEKLTISGTANEIETSVTNNTITVGLVDSVSGLTSVSATTLTDGSASLNSGALTLSGALSGATTGGFSGLVTAGSFTDGALTIDSGNISSGVNGTFSGTVQGGTLSDGTLSIASGSISSGVGATFSGTVQGGTLTDGTLSASSGSITGAVNVTASGTVQYGSLSDGTITITGFVDEDNMASDSATLVPTQQSVKAYVDSVATAADLDFQGDSGGALAVDLDSQTFVVAGGDNINTAGSGQTLTVNLDSSISGLTSVSSTTLTDGTASLSGGALSGATTGAFSSDVTIGGNLTVSGTTTSVNSTNTTIADTLIELQSGLSGANPNDIGHIYERGSDGDNGFLGWDQSVDRFIAATTTATGSSTGDLTLSATDFEAAGLIGTSATISGAVSFGSLTDSGESITVTKFVDEADGIASNDNDTTIPTSAAVVDYVANNGGDGLLIRQALTSGSSTIDTSAVPNVSGRTYYAERIVIKVGTAFSGNSINYMLVKENAGSGDTIVAKADADATTVGTYIIELDGDQTLTKNAAVQVQFYDSGDSAVSPTSGAGTISVHYNYV